MNTQDEDMRLKELFRNKLENAEVIPSSSVDARIMQKLARKEFVRFNPGRFNAFYLGGIIAVGITAAALIFGGKDKTEQVVVSNPVSNVENSISGNIPSQSLPQAVVAITQVEKTSSSGVKHKSVEVKESVSEVTPESGNIPANTPSVSHSVLNTSINTGSIIDKGFSDSNKLQTIKKGNEVSIEVSTIEGCVPLKVHFYNKTVEYDSCRWTFRDGGSSVERNPQWIFDVEGEYKVTLVVYFSDGSQLSSHVLINVHPKPQVRFETIPVKGVLPYDEIGFYNYSSNAIKYFWEFGDGVTSELFEPRHSYSRFGKYNVQLVAVSEFGCSDSLTVKNASSGSDCFINFPNAFIPNALGQTGGNYSVKSDESSQIFHPVCSGVTDYQLRIFSKLGILLFESNDVNIGWDGYFKGTLSEAGVYIWKVRGKFRNGEPFTKMGDLTILKN